MISVPSMVPVGHLHKSATAILFRKHQDSGDIATRNAQLGSTVLTLGLALSSLTPQGRREIK
jgi:hypothetical protein